jgi:hypothetical protein
MRKFLILSLTLCAALFAQSLNTNGYLDTAWILGSSGTNLTYTTKLFPLTKFEDIRVICRADDTSETGFGSDLINFGWGYRTGTVGLSKSGTLDTFFTAITAVDTLIKTDDTTGAWLYQTKKISPDFDQYIQFFAQGIGSHSTDSAVKINFQVVRRLWVPSRNY